jgi:hypothetical protein
MRATLENWNTAASRDPKNRRDPAKKKLPAHINTHIHVQLIIYNANLHIDLTHLHICLPPIALCLTCKLHCFGVCKLLVISFWFIDNTVQA